MVLAGTGLMAALACYVLVERPMLRRMRKAQPHALQRG